MKLKKNWLKKYQAAIIKVSPESPYYSEFKYLLRQYLFEAQLRNHLPSQSAILDALPGLLEEAENNTSFGRADPDRLDAQKMDQALQEMMFTPVVTDHDERGDLDGPWLKVFGIISTNQLSKAEISYIEKNLRAEEDPNFSAIRVTLVSAPITKAIDEIKQDRINREGLSVAQELLFRDAAQFPTLSKKYKRTWVDKARTWTLFQTV